MINLNRKTLKRSMFVLGSILLVFLIIISTLFNLQILGYSDFQDKVIEQMTVETNVNPNRGLIYDRNGKVLASNKTTWILYAIPKKITEAKQLSIDLSDILLNINSETILKKLENKSYKYQIISNSIDEIKTEQIRQYIDNNSLSDQLQLLASSARYYPYSDLASHTLGFVNSDGVGIYGLEKEYNNILEGIDGKYITSQDANSSDMPFQYEIYLDDKESGYDIVTTIDLYIQHQLESQLELAYIESGGQNRATGIVMNPQNGEILAMAVYPYFDLNNPYNLDEASQEILNKYSKGTKEYKNEYLNLLFEMWNNKAVSELYEPGSTFKLITTSVALQEKVARITDVFQCSGSLKVDGFYRAISCHKKTGHGSLNFKEALQQSCNPSMINLAFRIGKEKFYNYFVEFGYTRKTGIDLPSESLGVFHEYSNFSNVSLAVYSFGQTFKTTAIQQLRGISVVANGGYLVQPHLLKQIVDKNGDVVYEVKTGKEQILDTNVSETISQILKEGVDGNGGAKNAYVAGYDIAAKTGTSEKKDKFDENGNTSYRVSSCIGYAPSNNAQIAIIMIVDEPSVGSVYGSVVVAPYISNLMELILPYLGVEAHYSETDLEHKEITVPDLNGMDIEEAINTLKSKGIAYEVIGDGDSVLKQMPKANYSINQKNGKIMLYTSYIEESYIKVPNIIGKSAEEANQLLIDSGLNVSIEGDSNYSYGQTARVSEQFPMADTYVEMGSVVSFKISFTEYKD